MRPFCYPAPSRSENPSKFGNNTKANNTPNHEVRSAPINGHRLRGGARPKSVELRCGAVALGRTYPLPPLSSGGALVVPPSLRFHIPLIGRVEDWRAGRPLDRATFPVPSTSHAACGFPALRAPICFTPTLMGPILLGRLSARRVALDRR